ncbi:lytic transglycosylase domain-containing protein [Rhizobiaceae bacterium BDR2-2]|uniref:Lytic transglycosylase domain-containing protein n=1 Tax=Ectorhizobium quercum TaxID=2965071 RepID=A0AAE3SWF8_9HYPH|nr:lytic transglycosylase domain-containing protein [Ectorhizobium quercum]MCX8999097.1 lytic transglycosylase domain-containing protein [Ectorhizobium quercum]
MRDRLTGIIVSGALLAGAATASADPAADGARAPVQLAQAGPDRSSITGAIPRPVALPGAVDPKLKSALDALAARRAGEALAIRDTMPANALDRHVLTWAIAVSGQSQVPSGEIIKARTELQGWPGLSNLRRYLERALHRENAPAPLVLAQLEGASPETAEGAVILARALSQSGRQAEAGRMLTRFWTANRLNAAGEDLILDAFPSLLSVEAHKARMDYLLYLGQAEQAKRFATLGKAQSLYAARAAVIQRSPRADALLAAVDPRWKNDPGFLFARIKRLQQQDRFEAAAALLKQAPRDKAALVNPGEWWIEQRIVSRGLLDAGKFRDAYDLAANHSAESATDVTEAEFHAGWYALRALQKPDLAAVHFQRILDASSRPLSASRAWYWLGRTAEAGGKGDAAAFYAKAARHSSTFYGQLASAALKQKRLSIAYPTVTPEDRSRIAAREAVRTIERLTAAGHANRAVLLYHSLAAELTSPGELAILAAQAERGGNHQLSLQIGRIAYGRGIDVPALAFPLGVIPASANIAGSGKALAYAIARQESAFDPAAISSANAQGLLQILPTTARLVAGRHGIAYEPRKLTTDPGYNATIGAHYLGEQIDAFSGSYILTFIAYNAGPGRVPEWLSRYGDPRGKPIDDVIDWIERIPFQETRNYVQRVMENYQVYKTRLGQSADIEHDLRFGR